jgi:two-component system phosphate regulon sensor histidine kinase PhoR
MRTRKRRLLWQLFFAYLTITVIVIVSMGFYAAYRWQTLYFDRTTASLETAAKTCAARLGDPAAVGSPATAQAICDELSNALEMRFTVILSSGKVIADSAEDIGRMDNHRDRPEIIEELAGGVGRSTRESVSEGEELIYRAVPVRRGGAVAAIARASMPVNTLSGTVHAMYGQLAVVGLLIAALVAGASYWISRRITEPLREIGVGAERFAKGDLKYRLPDSDSKEISILVESMNRMAAGVDDRIHAILSRQNEHEAMLSSMEEGVLAVDNHGTILSLNETCAALLGADSNKLRGRIIYEVIRKPDLLQFVEAALANNSSVDGDLRFFGPDERWLNAHGTVLHDAHHKKIGALIVLHDVTRLRHLENVRRDFVANVSHELRTPITSIKGFVETLLDEALDNKDNAMRFLRIVHRQVNRLDAIISDLLMLSRIERGSEEQTIETEPEPLGAVLRAAAEMCEKRAVDKAVTLAVQCPDDLTANVNAPLLEQAVVNLIDNAIQYSGAGASVEVEGCRDGDDVVIRVKDDGCGIAAKHLPRLFERFYRVDKARSRELGGTGLGLAIVKHIVMSHQGSVYVESTVGKGSTFFIRLPAMRATVAAPEVVFSSSE